MVTDAELYFWVISGILSAIAFFVLRHLAKKDSENYVDVEKWK